MARPSAAMLLASILMSACGSAPAPALCPDHAPSKVSAALLSAKRASPPAAQPDEEDAGFRVGIVVKPVIDASAAVEIEISARGPASDLATWTIPAAVPGALRSISASDIDGAIMVTTSDGPSSQKMGSSQARATPGVPLHIQLARPPLGGLRLTYSLEAKPGSLATSPAIELDPDRFRAQGRALLAVPDAVNEAPLAISLKFDMSDLGEHLGAASSLGIGDVRDLRLRPRALGELMLIAGHMGHAIFDAQEGHDEAAWVGYTTFDPRPIAADVASFRTAAGQIFHDKEMAPSTLLIVADGRSPGSFVASRRAGGIIVHVGVGEAWSAPVRVAVAAEVLKAWIGERLWIGPTEPAREAEAYWFTEGVTRHLARDLLFRFGLISTSELLDEVHGLAGTIATSPHKAESNAALAKRANEPSVLPLLVARGALYASRLDALLRKKSGGKASIEDVLRALYARAREQRGALPAQAWTDVLMKELGQAEVDAFSAAIEKGDDLRVPNDAFGPCFKGGPRRYEHFELGFDEQVTRGADPHRIAGLRADGPAAKAGLRESDVLVDAKVTRGRSDVPVTLTVEREGVAMTIAYRPVGLVSKGQGWTRRKDVPEESCVR